MPQRRLFFIHGAGGYVEDGPLADSLSAAFGACLDMPRFSDDDMSIEAWARPIRQHLVGLGADDLVVAHSFGATVLLHVLTADGVPEPRNVVLLAMPNWGPEGWDVPQYVLADHSLPSHGGLTLYLHHCIDDDVVPVEHLDLNTALLPAATVQRHPMGGHQFDGLADVLARGRGGPDPG